MDIVRLRTLTRRSQIPYGNFEGIYVYELLEQKQYKYIAWLYYHVSWISFTDDVLDEALIFDKERIPKPGVSDEQYIKRVKHIIEAVHPDNCGAIIKDLDLKRRKTNARKVAISQKLSKRRLQAANQGHLNIK